MQSRVLSVRLVEKMQTLSSLERESVVEVKLVSKGGKEVALFDEGKQWEKVSESVVRVSVKRSKRSAEVELFCSNR